MINFSFKIYSSIGAVNLLGLRFEIVFEISENCNLRFTEFNDAETSVSIFTSWYFVDGEPNEPFFVSDRVFDRMPVEFRIFFSVEFDVSPKLSAGF